jgi:hypothetical protein
MYVLKIIPVAQELQARRKVDLICALIEHVRIRSSQFYEFYIVTRLVAASCLVLLSRSWAAHLSMQYAYIYTTFFPSSEEESHRCSCINLHTACLQVSEIALNRSGCRKAVEHCGRSCICLCYSLTFSVLLIAALHDSLISNTASAIEMCGLVDDLGR